MMNPKQFQRLVEYGEGYRLIILDTLSRIHQLDENSNGDMSRLVARLEQLALCTGASVLYLHHVNKGSARDGSADQQQAARGASALIDNARWCGYITRMSEDEAKRLSDRSFDRAAIGEDRRRYFIRFGISKQNYDITPVDRWFERQEGGVLRPVTLLPAGDVERRDRQLRRCADGF